MTTDKMRSRIQQEIEQIAENHVSLSQITHYSEKEAEQNHKLTWTNLSDIHISDDETIGSVRNLQEILRNKEYLVILKEEQEDIILQVEIRQEVSKRFQNKTT